MKPRAEEIQRVALAVVRELTRQRYVHAHKDEAALARRAATIIEDSFEQEMALEREAERMAAVHAGKMSGLDQRKIIQGIKARLAEERKFPL